MYPTLLHIYGPLQLNSFSVAIALGLAIFVYKALRHPGREQRISKEDFINGVIESALAGILGARILHIISERQSYTTIYQMLSIWNGGLSLFGGVLAIALYSYIYLRIKHIAILPVLDIAAIYAPLVHAIARIGCFLAGCCFGAPTDSIFGIAYTNSEVLAPLHVALHPAQLYSSAAFFIIYAIMRLLAQYAVFKPGQLTLLYVALMSTERFIIDFFRGDRITTSLGIFSFHQVIALILLGISLSGLVYSMRYIIRHNESTSL